MSEKDVGLMPVAPLEHDKYIPEEFNLIGKRNVHRFDGMPKATGKAVYTRDVQFPGMLYARVMTSPYAHAKIKSMDTSKAEALPGVRYVLRYDDPEVAGKMYVKWLQGGTIYYILGDTTHWQNEPVGAVVCAESEDIAEEALRLIEVEWEVLPFVLDEEEALELNAPLACPEVYPDGNLMDEVKIEQGDIQKGFGEADRIIEFTSKRQAHLWAGAEPVSCVVRWMGNYLDVWVHHQRPYAVKEKLSEWLNIPLNKIRVMDSCQGGMFGGFMDAATWSHSMWVITAILARRMARPVKTIYSRREEFYGESVDIATGHYKVGFKNDGTITAVQMNWTFANGYYGPADHLVANTKIPNISCISKVAYVNKGPVWACRSENLSNTMVMNLVFSHVAADLDMDPTKLALVNDGCEGMSIPELDDFKIKHGFPLRDSLKECIDAGKKAIGWDEKWHPPGARKLPNGRMHGMGFCWTHEWSDTWGAGTAAVLIHHDGSVDLIGKHHDTGINHETTYAQIVADELGMRIEDINCRFDNDASGFQLMSPAGATDMSCNGYIVKKAAKKAKRKLLELATTPISLTGQAKQIEEEGGVINVGSMSTADSLATTDSVITSSYSNEFANIREFTPAAFPGMKPEDLDVKDSIVFVKADPTRKVPVKEVVKNASVYYFSSLHEPIYAWAWHAQGMGFETVGRQHLCRQAYFMEVEVDTETGEIEIKKAVSVNDVGKVISPETCEGQQYGGMYMAIGRNKTEEIVYDEATGVILNGDLLNYKYATMLDCGPIDTLLVETSQGYGPYGSVGIGEDTADSPASILGIALYNATGVWVDDYPITPDKVLKALGKI